MPKPKSRHSDASDLLGFLPWATLIGAARLMPYGSRLAMAGRLGQAATIRLPHLRRRIETNLGHVMPALTAEARAAIVRACGDTFGRTGIEMLSARAFAARRPWTVSGEGVAAVEHAVRAGKGAIFVSGHFGQWEACRAWAKSLGIECGAVYRRVGNRRLDRLYAGNLEHTGGPIFPKSRRSIRGMIDHLGKGGVLGLLVDQYEHRAPLLDFLGKPAPTTLIAAELALKFRVPLIPSFGIRGRDGESIELVVEAPIPPSTPAAMMQAFNDSLAARVRAHPGQYYWLHRRWGKSRSDLEAKR